MMRLLMMAMPLVKMIVWIKAVQRMFVPMVVTVTIQVIAAMKLTMSVLNFALPAGMTPLIARKKNATLGVRPLTQLHKMSQIVEDQRNRESSKMTRCKAFRKIATERTFDGT